MRYGYACNVNVQHEILTYIDSSYYPTQLLRTVLFSTFLQPYSAYPSVLLVAP